MLYQKILSNGLRVIVIPQQSTQAATVLVLVGTGSKYETKRISGISHFLEHMFFKGTLKRPTQLEVAEELDRVGGSFNAFTSAEYTGYYAKVNASHTDLALDWVSDILLHSLLPAKEVRKERGVIVEEINLYYDNPGSRVEEIWPELLYGDQPAGWNIAGDKETVSRMTRKNLVKYMQSQYTAANTVLCVAGNVDAAKVFALAGKLFSSLPSTLPAKKATVADVQAKPEVLLEFRKIDQTHIAFGARGFSLFHPHREAQDVLAVVLGGMMSSRLFTQVREKHGLAYSISTNSETNTDTGWLMTTAGIKNEYVEKAIKVIIEEYKRVKRDLISVAELEKAKEHEIGRHILQMESSSAQAEFFGMQELLERKILTPEELYGKIRKVTAEEIRELARVLFCPDRMNLALVGPYKDKEKILKLLNV
ncbi:MAG: hypothetical protein A2748_02805 [Candidatus Wildermuthbacteria bacterium RIFCSPHIGHO2_01_FULL_45_20]|uniref:Peptidase M16 n=1 Tax=Candidatus Wildermuthbacteria bacterium RIFCSPHIGHO2_02_FULL_45_25 TaxID=1802450 RepID=A0A1G2R430_9BACT|nr:MAG: hypothetical protein A2748_02805 [Candidatus Wildermuthbacteria bacterium RIFCSPHIGHO2_01_FULL_45_20]OHA67573.1 MAG: hypothetical protein A3C04_00945 [Candidatus Wildermuthbacteria bacterium RIFCSPHIGHO2_02_FULL_45_25]